ncbi:hypothetical protein E2562_015511 [Oryza meyeriana var. granulata]|uniref:Uncharacterized protein n=1 Tax=Oryza meyeriana var. granulata TaxID=110450 RepID=A0A6G1CQC9_9ORYZ|nr:hypothetical protein E2562_015511 [Oryza meyeriana var. granulata]
MFRSFFTSLSGEKLDCLREWLRQAGDFRFSSSVMPDDIWEQLYTMIQKQQIRGLKRKRSSSASLLHTQVLPAISRVRSAFVKRERFVRAKLEELLDIYGKHHPWEPRYKLDMIRGLEESTSFHCKK